MAADILDVSPDFVVNHPKSTKYCNAKVDGSYYPASIHSLCSLLPIQCFRGSIKPFSKIVIVSADKYG